MEADANMSPRATLSLPVTATAVAVVARATYTPCCTVPPVIAELYRIMLCGFAPSSVNVSVNVGVELGQLAFVTAVLTLVRLVRLLPSRLPAWGQGAAGYAIGSLAAFWVFARLAAAS